MCEQLSPTERAKKSHSNWDQPNLVMENKSPVGKLALTPKGHVCWGKELKGWVQNRLEEEIKQHLKPKNDGRTFSSI